MKRKRLSAGLRVNRAITPDRVSNMLNIIQDSYSSCLIWPICKILFNSGSFSSSFCLDEKKMKLINFKFDFFNLSANQDTEIN